jgi:C-terminal processing protease CtpA/Prc/ribosomal protein S16
MKYASIFVLFFFLNISSYSAQTLSRIQKLESLCKVWGFLKYYHPNVANGNFDWDGQLLQKLSEVEKVDNKDQLNDLYFRWIENLGTVKPCNTCNSSNAEYFLKNFNLNWINNEAIFSKQVSESLKHIENNRSQSQYYLKKDSGGAVPSNEKEYGTNYTSKEIALLELFKYWNYVEYFYPYKYMTDQKWDDVLIEMLPKFSAIKNTEEYYFLLLELATKTDDSHSTLRFNDFNRFLGERYLPVHVKMAENKFIITQVYSLNNNSVSNLQKNDIIVKINNQNIGDYFKDRFKYIPASNISVKWRNTLGYHIRSQEDRMKLEIIRDNNPLTLNTQTFLPKDLKISKAQPSEKWKSLSDKTGYVNMELLEPNDVSKMYRDFKKYENIIFDLRNYPQNTFSKLAEVLFAEEKVTNRLIKPDFSYPGKYITQDIRFGKKENPDYYKGKIIVLVDENTQSKAEYTCMILQAFGNTVVIGSQTAGADGDVINFSTASLPATITGIGVFSPTGKETQRIGIIPDITVKPSIEGTMKGKDEVLEKALEYIKTGN